VLQGVEGDESMEVNERDIQLKVPSSALTRLMEQLQPEDMLRLRQWLDEKLAEYEDELMLANPRIMAEIREARMEYEAGREGGGVRSAEARRDGGRGRGFREFRKFRDSAPKIELARRKANGNVPEP